MYVEWIVFQITSLPLHLKSPFFISPFFISQSSLSVLHPFCPSTFSVSMYILIFFSLISSIPHFLSLIFPLLTINLSLNLKKCVIRSLWAHWGRRPSGPIGTFLGHHQTDTPYHIYRGLSGSNSNQTTHRILVHYAIWTKRSFGDKVRVI